MFGNCQSYKNKTSDFYCICNSAEKKILNINCEVFPDSQQID